MKTHRWKDLNHKKEEDLDLLWEVTHERNVLMWYVRTLLNWRQHVHWLIPIGWIIGAALVLSSCTSPTKATDIAESRNEILAVEYAACHSDYHNLGFEVAVYFVDYKRVDGALAWGSIQDRSITLVRPALNTWAPVDVEMVVGHEVCHVMGLFNEGIATVCASDAYYNAGCH